MYPNPLAARLNLQIDVWNDGLENIKPRWESVQQLYNVDPGGVSKNIVDGLEAYCYSIWTAKADKLIGDCVAALTTPSPMVQVIPNNPNNDAAPNVERIVDEILSRSGFKRILGQALIMSANTNLGPVSLVPKVEGGTIVGFEADWLDPKNFCIYPVDVEYLKDATTIGRRFYESRASIKQNMKNGVYKMPKTDELPSIGDKSEHTRLPGAWDVMSNFDEYAEGDDEPVELFDLITRTEKGIKRVVVVRDVDLCLVEEDYPYAEMWYAVFRFVRAEKRLICNGSLGGKVADYCFQHSDLMNAMMGGVMETAFPSSYTIGANSTISVAKRKVGEMINFPEGTQVGVFPNQFRADLVIPMLQLLEGMIEQTLGISAISTGKMPGQETKATTINVLAANDQKREASYLDSLSEAIEDIALIVIEYLKLHWDDLSEDYKAAYPELEENRDWQTQTYRVEVTGKSGDSNPEILLARLQMILQLAGMPNSPFDQGKVSVETVQALDLPIPIQRLMSDQYTQVMNALGELAQNGINPEEVLQAGIASVMGEIERAGPEGASQPGMEDGAELPQGLRGVGEGPVG